MLPSRTEKILKAVVRDYILRGEPVASEDLCRRHNFGVKAASIRAELLELTRGGFLIQPHVSGGRVPTEKGYRFFVDQLYANVFNEDQEELNRDLNGHLSLFEDIFSGHINSFIKTFSKEMRVLGLGYDQQEEEVYKTGLDELCSRINFREQREFLEVVRDFERLDKSVGRLFEIMSPEDNPHVFIGSESPITESVHLSVIADAFNVDDRKILIAIIGPKRMDYSKPLKLFRAVKEDQKKYKKIKNKKL